jgi:hypothetical protein
MKTLKLTLARWAAVASICALLLPSFASASPKPLDAAAVREKIVKRGVGSWIYIEERSGVALVGRITSIDADQFGMQLHNYPDVTPVLYSDVSRIRLGPSRGGVIAIIGVTVGAAVISAIVIHHEYEVNKPQLPTMPANPVFP